MGKCFSFQYVDLYWKIFIYKILSSKILILWLMLLPCYGLMLLPFVEFGRCYNQNDNGISMKWNNLVIISILMADVIAICG